MTAPSSLSSLTAPAAQFVEKVLALNPKVAFFDCDGTLWDLDSGEGFYYWSMENGLMDAERAAWARERYQQYRDGVVDEATMCGEMATIYEGANEQELLRKANLYFEQRVQPRIFPEMYELCRQLHERGCELWAVSSTNQWLITEAARRFFVPAERVLAASVEVRNGRVTGQLIRVPSGSGKAEAIRKVHSGAVDAAFGNSRWDAAMLTLARHPFAINPNADLAEHAQERAWYVYQPERRPRD